MVNILKNSWEELYWKLPLVIGLNVLWLSAGLIDFMGFNFHGKTGLVYWSFVFVGGNLALGYLLNN